MLEGLFSNKKNAIIISLTVSFIVMAMKFSAYLITKSNAILTDAAESIVNIVAASFALYSLHLSELPRDENHPYGHGKVEFFSSGLEGFLIIMAGVLTLVPAINALRLGNVGIDNLSSGLGITFFVIIINGIVGYLLINYGKKLHSIVLEADGHHLLVDTVSSIVLLIGLFAVKFTGYKIIDPILAIIMAFYIIYNGVMIFRKSVSGLMDETDYDVLKKIIEILKKNRKDEWIDIHNFRVKKYGADLHIDCHLTLPYYLSLQDAHEEVSGFEKILRKNTVNDVELFIHSDPCLPDCCHYCRVKNCDKRTQNFEKEVLWTAETLISNQKHFNY